MIEGGELLPFVLDVLERREEREAWEFYLAKVREGTFRDFYRQLKDHDRAEAAKSTMTTEEIINDSLMISGASKEVRGE